MKAVSVVIPAHNASATIGTTLASLRGEAEVIGEILLVDDASTDDTAAVARRAAAQLSLPLRVLPADCRDAGGARNGALAQALHPWVYLIDADDLHLQGGLRALLRQAQSQPKADMIVGAYRRRVNGQDRQIKVPNGYQDACLANASAYVKGDIRSVAVGSVLASRRLIGETRFPVSLAYDEDTLFWARLMSKASLAMIPQPVMVYEVSPARSDDRFAINPVRRFLEWRRELRTLTDCNIPVSALKTREGLVALKIARVHYARGDLDTAARFLAVAAAAPKRRSEAWRCLRYRLKLAVRCRLSAPRIELQGAL
ncbi:MULTISPECIES: glycosyltransferase family A protein [Mesorhizobium]|uniref:Glycosyl transferase family 2 n=1 Tax=Mesorhizobium opportunistum (strain LMG 24607 / HAMBI 3007 / WSM2075) TaxID=536019 RepID=F7YAC3_MESOW|nr:MULTISPECIES: glycosyltransferase family A protein [Mesorhizobium]AEH86522.1 glycosyl transferase family 2 [Mesorhizobium opportunistum WSM2075]MCA0032404.1 glycosyltransferase family 2 protein [Mesorhizobium sp. B263B2A]TPN44042.1 glycosyltransferase family 2 protein [Mesorhizobium sp. B1-1-9]TPN54890.1 glycosyltransferase family 2 protein [Mesorhizobium sp. B1-1-7]